MSVQGRQHEQASGNSNHWGLTIADSACRALRVLLSLETGHSGDPGLRGGMTDRQP